MLKKVELCGRETRIHRVTRVIDSYDIQRQTEQGEVQQSSRRVVQLCSGEEPRR